MPSRADGGVEVTATAAVFGDSLAADAALPAVRTSSSDHLGWTSALVRTYREHRTTDPVDLPAVGHPALVMVTGGLYRVESRGSGRWRGTVYRAGSIGLTPPGTGNTLRWRTLGPDPMTSVHVHLARPVWDDLVAHAGGDGPGSGFPNRLLDDDPLVTTLVRALQGAVGSGAPALYVDSVVHLLGVHLLVRPRADERVAPGGTGLTPRALADVVEHMRENIGREVTLDGLAGVAGLSKYHFLRQFKATTGATPFAFLAELRMQHATVLLTRRRRPVDGVAHACGYRSVSRFSAAFRRHHGVSPAHYRDHR